MEQAIPALNDYERQTMSCSLESNCSSVRSSSSSICSTLDGFRTMVDSDVPRCIFHTSQDFSIAEKLLVFVCSSRGLSCGIWSRSVLLQDGAPAGSMIPYFKSAMRAGYGVLVMNPNMNMQTMIRQDGSEVKLPIHGSSTQEEHVEHVWKNYIYPSAAHKIDVIAYGYGGVLVTNLIHKYRHELRNRLGNIAFIESSHKTDRSWSEGFRRFFSQHSISWKRSDEPLNTELTPAESECDGSMKYGEDSSVSSASTVSTSSSGSTKPARLRRVISTDCGCLCLSAGPGSENQRSPAYTTLSVLNTVFEFLESPNAYEFQRMASRRLQLGHVMREMQDQQHFDNCRTNGSRRKAAGSSSSPTSSRPSSPTSPLSMTQSETSSVSLQDFELMKVVGRGAFGKVMLVRKKNSNSSVGSGKVYAMKVLKKSAVFAKNQIEHTKTERRILEGVDHPFMVKLRFAFQNESKLYFVMDYYNGGTLHFHLRQARHFDVKRTQFYAAQLVLAISHLHTYHVVYRDLKPENILMDDQGFLALTDFGLSHDNYDARSGQCLSTFCGTPEYIAPELIRRTPYGKSVDYWSLGILIYEMLSGYTPFFHANRKRNFENIVKLPLRFPVEFSDDTKSLLRGLLTRDPSKRLGSGPCGVQEIMDHPFFSDIDWEKLFRRQVVAPFKPTVKKDGETTNIPDFFKRQDAVDSVANDAPISQANVFDNFTYVDPYQL